MMIPMLRIKDNGEKETIYVKGSSIFYLTPDSICLVKDGVKEVFKTNEKAVEIVVDYLNR